MNRAKTPKNSSVAPRKRKAEKRRSVKGRTSSVPERTIDLLLRVAEDQFAAVGYNAASLATIARRTGIQKGSLFHYFPSKRQLFDAVAARIFQKLAIVWGEVAAIQEPAEALLNLLGRLHDLLAQNPNYPRILLQRVIEDPGAVRTATAAFIRPLVMQSAELIRKASAEGSFRRIDDPVAVAMSALGMPLVLYALAPMVEACTDVDVFAPSAVEATRASVLERAATIVLHEDDPRLMNLAAIGRKLGDPTRH